MVCRSCGATIADKAIVCYRCGTPTEDHAPRPAAARRRGRGRSRLWLILLIVMLLLVLGTWFLMRH